VNSDKSSGEDDADSDQGGGQKSGEGASSADSDKKTAPEYVHIGFGGIHVKDDENEVHIDRHGIHVTESKGDNVHVDQNGVFVNGKKYDRKPHSLWHRFPFAIIVTIAFLLLGLLCGMWHPAWILFLTIPVYHSLVEAVSRRNAHYFAYPVLTVIAFLLLGFYGGFWAWAWVVFLTIPIYYAFLPNKHSHDPHNCCDDNCSGNCGDRPNDNIFTHQD